MSLLSAAVIGGHTDSPNLKIKPNSSRSAGAGGITQLSVETYGGGLWHTWFDRDLSIAGRVFVRDSATGRICEHLVDLKKPICRVPSLCIHLQTADERAAFKFSSEDNLQPILAQAVAADLSKAAAGAGAVDGWSAAQEPVLLRLLSEALGCASSDIADFELSLYDVQGASINGASEEFLVSARLDNQGTCICGTSAMLAYASDASAIVSDPDVSVLALFDHEEVGSASFVGAGSPISLELVARVSEAFAGEGGALSEDDKQRSLRQSFVLSSDMAHAVHPNYAGKHDGNHRPRMNGGFVIKTNSNQRYTTNAFSGFVLREVARIAGLKVQEFVVRNDCPCGSTIGPIISERTGIRAVDGGMAMLSMHSIRETMGVHDLENCHSLFVSFWTNFRKVEASCIDCK